METSTKGLLAADRKQDRQFKLWHENAALRISRPLDRRMLALATDKTPFTSA